MMKPLDAKRINEEIYNETVKNSAVKAAVRVAKTGHDNSLKTGISRRIIRSGACNITVPGDATVVVPDDSKIYPYIDFKIPTKKHFIKLSCFGGDEELLKKMIGKKFGVYLELKTKKINGKIYPYLRAQIIPSVIFDVDMVITVDPDVVAEINKDLPYVNYKNIQKFHFGFVKTWVETATVAA